MLAQVGCCTEGYASHWGSSLAAIILRAAWKIGAVFEIGVLGSGHSILVIIYRIGYGQVFDPG